MGLKLLTSDDYDCAYPAWEKAALTSEQGDPFCCSPVWQLSFHRSFAGDCRVDLRQGENCALAFSERATDSGGRCLVPLEPSWLFGSPLLGEGAADLLAEALEDWRAEYGDYPDLLISGLVKGGKGLDHFLREYRDEFDWYFYGEGRQCSASLAGGVDGFLSRRSANHRRKLKKSARLAAGAGVYFERRCPASQEEARAVYARMLAVEERSWKGIGHCGMTEPASSRFYGILLTALARTGDARVIFARHEDQDIGFIFGGMAGDIYRGQQFSFADEWRSLSIGNLLQMEKIRWLCEEGAQRYDMGPISGPRMAYKEHWTERVVTLEAWLLHCA